MVDTAQLFRRSLRPLLGNVIGVGIFALPYAAAQAGFGVAVFAILLCGGASLVAYRMYADIALHTPGHARFVGLMREYLGPFGGAVAACAFFISVMGTLIAYVLVGGSFAHVLFAPIVGGSLLFYRILFLLLSGGAVLGGLLSVIRVQKYVIGAYLSLIALMVLLALPHVNVQHFVGYQPAHFFLPFGVALFAFSGFGAVPEMRDILGSARARLPQAVTVGFGIVIALYLVFTATVVGVSGSATSQEALYGLAQVLGPAVLILGSAIGLCTVGAAFMTHGLVVTNTLAYDFRTRYLTGWAIAVVVPLLFLLFGTGDFVHVIDITGGVGGGLSGLLLLAAYERMRLHPQTPKHFLSIPKWMVVLTGFVFLFNVVLALTIDAS